MQAEIEALTSVFDALARPILALVGGAKVTSKIDLLRNLVREVATLALGGAMANTSFLEWFEGKSLPGVEALRAR